MTAIASAVRIAHQEPPLTPRDIEEFLPHAIKLLQHVHFLLTALLDANGPEGRHGPRAEELARLSRTGLLKVLAAGLIALISLSQLGSGAQFGAGGPKALLPASVTAVVVAAVLFGLAYGNFFYGTASLDSRLALPEQTQVSEGHFCRP